MKSVIYAHSNHIKTANLKRVLMEFIVILSNLIVTFFIDHTTLKTYSGRIF